MKKSIKTVLAVVAMSVMSVFAFAKDPCEGFWISVDDKTGNPSGGWCITVDGDTLTGEMTNVPNQDNSTLAFGAAGKGPYSDFPVKGELKDMPVVGTPWIYNMKKVSEGKWAKGHIIDPGDGSKYACTITFHAADGKKYKVDTLEMRGSIGPFGRSQFWVACTEDEARDVASFKK